MYGILRQKTRHCSRNTSMSRKRRKSDHTAAGGWKFHFFFVAKVDFPSTSQTVLRVRLYCERSGAAERRLHMTAVFCCGCWFCCVRCCRFCVLQILFCRVLSLPLTLKISQTCILNSLHLQHPKNNHTAVATNTIHLLSNALYQKGQNRTTCARNHTKT